MEQIFNKIIVAFFVITSSTMLAYHGLSILFGAEIVKIAFKIIVGGACVGIGTWIVIIAWSVPMAVVSKHLVKRREALAHIRQIEAYAGAAAIKVATGDNVVMLDSRSGYAQQFSRSRQEQPQIVEQPPQEHLVTAIDVGLEIDRAFVWGPTRGGKTFYCKQLAHHLVKRGDIVCAIDTKDFDPDDPWPSGVRIIGQSDNWDQIAEFWNWVDTEKQRRGRDMRATKRMPKIYIIFDEINDAIYERPQFADKYVRILRKYAQYRINIICVGQTDTVDSIGLKGLNQLKRCFDVTLGFEKDKQHGRYNSFVDYGDNKKVELTPYMPVRFNACHTGTPAQAYKNDDYDDYRDGCDRCDGVTGAAIKIHPEFGLDAEKPPVTRFYDSKVEKILCEAHDRGVSQRRICELLGWPVNGRNVSKVKAVLEKYCIVTTP